MKRQARPARIRLRYALTAYLISALVPASAQAADLDAAEAALRANNHAEVVKLLLPAYRNGTLTDARALYVLSRGCFFQRPTPLQALKKQACNNQSGRITFAAAEAGSVDAMLDLAYTLESDLPAMRHPDFPRQPDRAYFFALAAGEFASTDEQRERASKAIAEIGAKLPAATREAVRAQIAAANAMHPPPGKAQGDAAGGVASAGHGPAGAAGPFGLTFGMSATAVPLKPVATDKYGRDSIGSGKSHYSCNDTLTFPFNGSYNTSDLSGDQRDNHLAMRELWLDALRQTDPEAVTMATGMKGATVRFGVTFESPDSALTDVTIKNYATDSGTTLCLGFFKDQLFRVKVNLSGKRDLIDPLVEKVKKDYAGARYEYWPKRPVDSTRTYLHRWAGHPQGVWITIEHDVYERPRNVDWSKAYAFGGTPPSPPSPAELSAEADYVYAPLFARALAHHRAQKQRAAEQQQTRRTEQRDKAMDEF